MEVSMFMQAAPVLSSRVNHNAVLGSGYGFANAVGYSDTQLDQGQSDGGEGLTGRHGAGAGCSHWSSQAAFRHPENCSCCGTPSWTCRPPPGSRYWRVSWGWC